MIYFDNAATTGKKPEKVIYATANALKNYSVNPGRGGYKESIKCSEMIFGCRKKAAEFFGASGPERVIFTANCTASLNYVIKGILRSGDHCIASSLEHNAVARPLYKLSKTGVSVDFAKVTDNEDETLAAFKRLIRPNTKLIICTHASNVTGRILPIKEIGAICKEKNIYFAVDAAQTAGILPINVKEMNIDYLCVACHKGLYSPMGIGLLIAEKNLENTLIEGGTGTHSLKYEQPDELPERFESGTLNVPAIAGLYEGLQFVNGKGLKSIYAHELMLAKRFYEGLEKLGNAEIYSHYPQEGYVVPTISFNIKDKTSEDVANLLAENNVAVRAGIHCAPLAHSSLGTSKVGTVRVCFSVFNNTAEVDRVLNVLKKVTKNS